MRKPLKTRTCNKLSLQAVMTLLSEQQSHVTVLVLTSPADFFECMLHQTMHPELTCCCTLQASETAELVEKLEDSQMTLGSMASNRYSAPFREEVNGWINKLSTVSETVEQWLMVQSMWMYMEAVFSGGDIVKQLPQEAKRFQNIDKAFMKVCSHVSQCHVDFFHTMCL